MAFYSRTEEHQDSGHPVENSLQEKAERVRWALDTRNEQFALFSKSGFVDGLADDLGENWSLFSLEEIDVLLSPTEESRS